jgi:hypothetical protein
MNILNLSDSNKEIIRLIQNNNSFSIIRLGIGPETYLTYEYLINKKINTNYLHPELLTLYNAGIYTNNKDLHKIELYCDYYNLSIKNSNILASMNCNTIISYQNFFSQKYNLPQIHSRTLEPFYIMQENEIPWTHYLKDKKILIIHPFTKSFKLQMKNGFQIFKNKKMFLDDQKFIFYKTFQTIAGNHIHNNWFETFTLMCNDIKKIDFQIALIACGGYGLPLCNFIKTELNKSAIYIGGGLQLLFGVMGKRWENIPMWKKIIEENKCKFIRPFADEICNNLMNIEDGCYW